VPDIIRGNTDTVGLRVPDHLTTLEIINKLDAAILGPSANFHGGKTPFDTAGLDPQLLRLADFIIPGTCHKRYASTVIDCSVIPWKTLRKGAVDI
jgi:L-threonylcarbamoyladenylate synthase